MYREAIWTSNGRQNASRLFGLHVDSAAVDSHSLQILFLVGSL
jgi:hypothetical protein